MRGRKCHRSDRFAGFYDGETIDLREHKRQFAPVQCFSGHTPKLIDHIGSFVRETGVLIPEKKGDIYDFKQNFAGVVRLKVRAQAGTVITVRHAEILMNGKLFNKNYRSAKATLTLICKEGVNEFCPTFTYMGFRYAEIGSDKPVEIVSVEGAVYSSDMARRGTFSCGDENINKLQSCIEWSMRSNFVDIPTDCPQRDERLGWTGDICVFANTACYNFDTRAFFKKWLFDLRSEQVDGNIPVTIPSSGMYEPNKKHPIPLMTWGDAAVVVPWNVYMNFGDKGQLAESWDGGYNRVTSAEFKEDDYIVTKTQRTLTEEGVNSCSLRRLPVGTVLLSSRAPIGKVAIAGREMYCNQGFKNCGEYLYPRAPNIGSQNEFARFVEQTDKSKFSGQFFVVRYFYLTNDLVSDIIY